MSVDRGHNLKGKSAVSPSPRLIDHCGAGQLGPTALTSSNIAVSTGLSDARSISAGSLFTCGSHCISALRVLFLLVAAVIGDAGDVVCAGGAFAPSPVGGLVLGV